MVNCGIQAYSLMMHFESYPLNEHGWKRFSHWSIKGQLISKAIYGLITSPKKRTDKFDLFAFLLFTANKKKSFVRFLGESTARQSAFRFFSDL